MLIDLISDIHEDSYLGDTVSIERINSNMEFLFPENRGEILLIAGDLSHKIERIVSFLILARDYYGYKSIFYVIGNHELFLTTEKEKTEFKYNSLNKFNKLKNEILKLDNIYLLDGDVIKYKDLYIGGSSLWYDGSFARKKGFDSKEELQENWYKAMPDGKYIYGIGSINQFFEKELEKLEKIYMDSDIILTHINPISEEFAFSEPYKKSLSNAFFSFDGEGYVKKTSAKIWLYGHTHIPKDYIHFGTRLICNPYGYPRESRKHKIKQIKL